MNWSDHFLQISISNKLAAAYGSHTADYIFGASDVVGESGVHAWCRSDESDFSFSKLL